MHVFLLVKIISDDGAISKQIPHIQQKNVSRNISLSKIDLFRHKNNHQTFLCFCHKINSTQYTKTRKWAHTQILACLLISRLALTMTLTQTRKILSDNV